MSELRQKIEREIAVLESKRTKLDETLSAIDAKLNGNINEATRGELEDMYGEIEDKFSKVEEKINELQEKIEAMDEGEYHGQVNQSIISEIKNLPGFKEIQE
jgi:chaperonin cofactor prefoldin